MIPITSLRPWEEMFTHISNDGTTHHFAITRLACHLRQTAKPVTIDIVPSFAKRCIRHRGIESHRLRTWSDPALPIIYLEWPDGSHLLCDGHHRYVSAWKARCKHIQSYMVPREVWVHFLIDGAPKTTPAQLLASKSGK